MQYTLFGAIDIGSSEMELKIFELSRGKGMREIDCIRNRLELGKDTYATGKISTEKLEELCLVLQRFHLHHEKLQGGGLPGLHHECDPGGKKPGDPSGLSGEKDRP